MLIAQSCAEFSYYGVAVKLVILRRALFTFRRLLISATTRDIDAGVT